MSAISAKQAASAVAWLKAVVPSNSTTTEAQVGEITHKLRQNVDDAEHLKATIDRLVDTCHWFPSVAEVVAAINATAKERQEVDFVPMGCRACEWTGWRRVVDEAGREAVTDCRCRLEGRMQERPADWWRAEAASQQEVRRLESDVARMAVQR